MFRGSVVNALHKGHPQDALGSDASGGQAGACTLAAVGQRADDTPLWLGPPPRLSKGLVRPPLCRVNRSVSREAPDCSRSHIVGAWCLGRASFPCHRHSHPPPPPVTDRESFVAIMCMLLRRKKKQENQGNLILLLRSNYINILSQRANAPGLILYLGYRSARIILSLKTSFKQTPKGNLFLSVFYIPI